ncbi:flippase [Candidatus Falkowbacteria bacterium]|nr:flippase [Candidatus Falkowbacteria bacterium]
MSTQPVAVAKNTTYLTAAYIIQKVFSFLYFILIARGIGVEDIGKYVFALSFTTIFGVFIDLGFSPVLTREAAKDWGRARDLLNNIIGVKMILAVLTYGAVLLVISSTGKELLVRQLVSISAIIMVLDSFYLSFYAVLRAAHNLRYEAIGMIVGQILILLFGVAALSLGLSLHWLIGSILAGSAFNFFYAFWLLEYKIKLRLRPQLDWPLLKSIFLMAAPFAIAGIFARVYSSIDSVLLSTLAGDSAVGWYSAGYKITFALQFVPLAFAAALFPAMSKYFVSDRTQLARLFEKAMYYLMLIALPVTLGVFVLAREFIVTMYGLDFAPTALALQILIFSLVFNFLGFPIGSLLNACGQQTQNTINMGITMVINVILNLILIPLLGQQAYLGAAAAALVSQIILFSLGLYFVGQVTAYNQRWLLLGAAKVLCSSLLMSLVIVVLKPYVYFLALVPVGGLMYLVSLYALRGISKTEVVELYQSFKK